MRTPSRDARERAAPDYMSLPANAAGCFGLEKVAATGVPLAGPIDDLWGPRP